VIFGKCRQVNGLRYSPVTSSLIQVKCCRPVFGPAGGGSTPAMKSSPLPSVPLSCCARPWRLLRLPPLSDPAASLAREDELLAQVLAGKSGPLALISRHPCCLVATRREARWPDFGRARRQLAAEGWPVVVRCSGGSCVPQGPGILNLSLLFSRPVRWRLEDGYRLLTDLLTAWLAGFGLQADTGEVAGAFCDGRYNLRVNGRKLAGTAQRWTGGDHRRRAVLVHACLLVEPDLETVTRQVNRFHALCGRQRRFDPGACTSLRECLQGTATGGSLVAEAEERLAALLEAGLATAVREHKG